MICGTSSCLTKALLIDKLTLLRPQEQHGERRLSHDLVGDAAKHHALPATATMRCHHYQIGLLLIGDPQDLLRRLTTAKAEAYAKAARFKRAQMLVNVLNQPGPLRVFFCHLPERDQPCLDALAIVWFWKD